MKNTQPIRSKGQVRTLAEYFLKKGQLRNHLLVVLSFCTALRISDLLRLTWNDVYDFDNKRFRLRIDIIEKKTRKAKSIALSKTALNALSILLVDPSKRFCFLIENPRTNKAISRIQAYRLIRAAAEALVFQSRVSCHSLRKTFGYHAWKSGVSPAIIMEIYNHSSLAVTRRYLGITQDEKDEVYLGLNMTG